MEAKELRIIDQTAHLLGNYHKYYTFHSVDSRTSLLEKKNTFYSLWKAVKQPEVFVYLDIGCNEGDLTLAVHKLIRSELPDNVKVVTIGVDIDGALISFAREKITGKASQSNSDSIYFENVDFTSAEQVSHFQEKVTSDWSFPKHQFCHLISVFSTTMWIHLNHGDEGLKQFFLSVKDFLAVSPDSNGAFTTNGALLVEPQPPKCYTNAARRCRKLRISYPPFLEKVDRSQVLSLLDTIIQQDVGLSETQFFGQEEWGRPLTLYYQNSLPFTLL